MNNKDVVRKLLNIIVKYKKELFLIFLCLLISTILNLSIPLLSKSIMDDGFIGKNQKLLIKLVLISMLIYIADFSTDILKERIRVDISTKIQYFLSKESFSHLLKLKISYFSNNNYAEILSNLSVDIRNIASIADEGIFFVITQGFSMCGGIIGLIIVDYRLTILVIAFIPIKYFAMKYFAKKRKLLMDKYINNNQGYAKWFGDTVAGVQEIKLFGIYDEKMNEFAYKQMEVLESQKKIILINQWNNSIDNIMIQLITMIIYIIGSNLVFNMELSIGSIFAFITYSAFVTGPIASILNIGYILSGIVPSTKRYYEFLYLEEEFDIKKKEISEYRGLKLNNIKFSYDNNKEVFKNVNLDIPIKSKIAIIGENGSGKSTFINLLTRFYIPTEGHIFLNDVDIFEFGLWDYRSMISVVSQQIYLFNTSIRENICLYREIEEKTILEVVRVSGLEDFINEVSLDYIVGTNGKMLSGGQRQKIALARSLIHSREIVIFDEATSNSDTFTEMQINNLLHTRLKDKTVIVVTHKDDILKYVDKIYTLNNGKLIISERD